MQPYPRCERKKPIFYTWVKFFRYFRFSKRTLKRSAKRAAIILLPLIFVNSILQLFIPASRLLHASTNTTSVPVTSCTGSGELFLYTGTDPFQPIETTLTVNHNQLIIFTRKDALLTAKINNTPAALLLEKTFASRFNVYSLPTSPHDIVTISGTSPKGARDMQGFLAQDMAHPVYDLSALQFILQDQASDTWFLTPGNYSYVFFDKYTINSPGEGPDTRNLNVKIDGPSGNILDQNYTQPHPAIVQGAAVDNFVVPVGQAGSYTVTVDSQDSIYWAKVQCPLKTFCGDGIAQNPNDDGIAENCDHAGQNGIVCTAGYGQACAYCSSTCQSIEVTGPMCGDNVKNGNDPKKSFLRGDANGDNSVNIGDPIFISLALNGRATFGCEDAADVNDDGAIDPNDREHLFGWIFLGTHPEPPAPGPKDRGTDPTDDLLTCGEIMREECDGTDGIDTALQSCSLECKIVQRDQCGNGNKEAQEECDDGNISNNDGCSASCKLEGCTVNCG